MKGTEELLTANRAGYCFFYGENIYEMGRTVEMIQKTFDAYVDEKTKNPIWKVVVWDFEGNDPQELLKIMDATSTTEKTLFIAKNFHWFLQDSYGNLDKSMVTYFQNRMEMFSSTDMRLSFLILGDVSFDKAIPQALSKQFLPLTFGLPDEKEINEILESVIENMKGDKKFKNPTKATKEKLVNAAKGMGAGEIKNSFYYSLIEDSGSMIPLTVSRLKAKDVGKTPGLSYKEYKGNITVIGFEEAKDFIGTSYNHPDALGCIFVGSPGTGKTMFCKWLSQKSGLPVIEWEMAQMMGEGLVGQAENAWKNAIEVSAANAPCILFIDELEKGLDGASSGKGGGPQVSGPKKTSSSQLLKFLSDNRPKGVYVLATCNDIQSIDPEWLRAGRWDCAPWYVDLPNEKTQMKILEHYKKVHKVEGVPVDMEGWSGAEIEACCKIAKIQKKSIPEVEKFIIPITVTMKEEIDYLKKWRVGRTNPVDNVPIKKKKIKKGKVERPGIEL